MKAVQGFLMDPDCFERVSGLKQREREEISTIIVNMMLRHTLH